MTTPTLKVSRRVETTTTATLTYGYLVSVLRTLLDLPEGTQITVTMADDHHRGDEPGYGVESADVLYVRWKTASSEGPADGAPAPAAPPPPPPGPEDDDETPDDDEPEEEPTSWEFTDPLEGDPRGSAEPEPRPAARRDAERDPYVEAIEARRRAGS